MKSRSSLCKNALFSDQAAIPIRWKPERDRNTPGPLFAQGGDIASATETGVPVLPALVDEE